MPILHLSNLINVTKVTTSLIKKINTIWKQKNIWSIAMIHLRNLDSISTLPVSVKKKQKRNERIQVWYR